MSPEASWHKVADVDELPEGRVKTITVGRRTFALSRYQGEYGCLDNACPHQGGPLGEGSIEKGWLRCPWHGYDYNPLDGTPPEGFTDTPACFPTEVRDDGVYVSLPPEMPRARTVSDLMVETMVNWGLDTVFGMVGHSNLGLAEALRAAEERGDLRYFGIRHEGAASFAASAYGKLTGRVAACFAIAGPGSTNLLTGLYDPRPTALRCLLCRARSLRACEVAGRFRMRTSPRSFPTCPGTHRSSRPVPTMPNW